MAHLQEKKHLIETIPEEDQNFGICSQGCQINCPKYAQRVKGNK